VPIILVGLKRDTRDTKALPEGERGRAFHVVDRREGEVVALEIGAQKYVECSSLGGEGVDQVFEAATRAILCSLGETEYSSCCNIL
jgi:GTPase SAR1 family protein